MDKNTKIVNPLILGKFKLIKKIGEGSAGKVYSGLNLKTKEPVAIKLEPKSLPIYFLKSEAIYLFMLKGVGIPKLKAFGTSKIYNILVENLLGDSLFIILKKYKNHIPLKDSLMIAIQVIERLEYIHSKNLIHRDIKPSNFLIGLEDPYLIYLIDFGLTKKYRSNRTGKHVKFKRSKLYNGTLTFASLNSLKGIEVSRRDDLESAAYMLIYLMKGSLPWISVKTKTKYEKYKKIFNMKLSYKPEELCKNLPNEIMEFFSYCQNLDFEQEPDYKYCYSLFNNALIKHGYSNDLIFSWIKNPEIKDKLRNMKDKINRSHKRRKNPQTRLFHFLLNSFETQKKIQSQKAFDIHNNSKDNKYFNHINSPKTPINQNSNISQNNKFINDEKIINSKLAHYKRYQRYHRICVEPSSNINNFSNKKLSKSEYNIPNLNKSNKKSNKIIHDEIAKTNNYAITNIKANTDYIRRNKKYLKISNNNYFNEASRVKTTINSINNSSVYSINSAQFDKRKDLYSNIILNNKKIIRYKKKAGNVVDSGPNMLVNYEYKSIKGSNINKTYLKNIKPKLKIDFNETALKCKLKNLKYKNITERKGGSLSRYCNNTHKTSEKIAMNVKKIYKPKCLKLNIKYSPIHFGRNFYKNENNTMILKMNNIPGFQRIKLNSIKEDYINS